MLITYSPMYFLWEYWIEHLKSGSFILNLYSRLGQSTNELQALQVIARMVFGALD